MAAKQTEACSVAVIAQRRRSRSGERKVFFFNIMIYMLLNRIRF